MAQPVTCLIPLALALAAAAASADTLKKVADNNKITLAYREASVAFSYLSGPDKPVGMMVEISEAIAAEVKKATNKPNLEVAWQAVTSANRIPLLQNGTVDLECGSTTNNSARGKDVQFAINPKDGEMVVVEMNPRVSRSSALASKATGFPIARIAAKLAVGYTPEELEAILHPMVEEASEAVGSMGDDTPVAVLSGQYRGLHHYFRQSFSQVTNPPIDSLRERYVMSLKTRFGNLANILDTEERRGRVLVLDSPVLTALVPQGLAIACGARALPVPVGAAPRRGHRA